MESLKYFDIYFFQLFCLIVLFLSLPLRIFPIGFEDLSSLKSDRFNEKYFLRWQEQLEAWLVSLGLLSALEKSLTFESSSSYKDSKSSEEIDYHCRFRILSCLSDELYETYRKYKTSKYLWQALEETYIQDNEGAIRFTIFDFHNFKMVDHISINDQIH